MKRIIALIGLATFSSFFWGVGVEPVNGQASCQATVDTVLRDIKRRGVKVEFRVLMDGHDSYSRNSESLNNARRKDYIVIDMIPNYFRNDKSVSIADNILESRVLLKSYATKIFQGCQGTGYVEIGRQEPTEAVLGYNYEIFGMTDDGMLGFKSCEDNSSQLINTITKVEKVGYPDHGYCAYVIPDF